jgi:hypothetical protein
MVVILSGSTPQSTLGINDMIINDITESLQIRLAIHDLPGAQKDLLQTLGAKNKKFTIKGTIFSTYALYWIDNVVNQTGSLTYQTDNGVLFVPTVTLYFYNYRMQDRANRPMERDFELEAIQVI